MTRLRYSLLLALGFLALSTWPAQAIGTPTTLTVTPSKLELVAGQTGTFKVEAVDAAKATLDVSGASVFSQNDPRGTISGLVYTAGKVGSWSVTVTYQGLTATVPVTVTAGALSEIVVNPNSSPETVALNKTKTFTAQGYDAKNNAVTVSDVVWSMTGQIGTIDSKGKFTPTTLGSGVITAKKGDVSGTVDIRVIAAQVTNTNANANSNTSVNSNANANTNVSANDNTNTAAPTNTNTSEDATTTTACTNGQNWLWGLLILVLLGGTAILYAFVPVTKTWPAAVGLGSAIILSILERRYDCAGHSWWPWIAIIGTAALTVFAYQQSPKKPQV